MKANPINVKEQFNKKTNIPGLDFNISPKQFYNTSLFPLYAIMNTVIHL